MLLSLESNEFLLVMNLDIFTPSYLIRIHEIIFENWIMEQHKKVFFVVFFFVCLFFPDTYFM